MKLMQPIGTASFDTVGPHVIELLFDHLHRPSDRLSLSLVCRATWACRCELVGRAGRFIADVTIRGIPRVPRVPRARGGALTPYRRALAYLSDQQRLTTLDRSIVPRVVAAFGPYIASSAIRRHIGAVPLNGEKLVGPLIRSAYHDTYLLRLACDVTGVAARGAVMTVFTAELADHISAVAAAHPPARLSAAGWLHDWVIELLKLLTSDTPFSDDLWARSSSMARSMATEFGYVPISEDETELLTDRMTRVIERVSRTRHAVPCTSAYLFDVSTDPSPLRRIINGAFIRLATPIAVGGPDPPPMRRMRLTANGIVLWPNTLPLMQLVRDMDAIDWDDRSIDPERYREVIYKLACAVARAYRDGLDRIAPSAASATMTGLVVGTSYIDVFTDNVYLLRRTLAPSARGYAALLEMKVSKFAEILGERRRRR